MQVTKVSLQPFTFSDLQETTSTFWATSLRTPRPGTPAAPISILIVVEREATEVTTVHPTSILTVVGLNIGRGDDLTKYVYVDPNSGRAEHRPG